MVLPRKSREGKFTKDPKPAAAHAKWKWSIEGTHCKAGKAGLFVIQNCNVLRSQM